MLSYRNGETPRATVEAAFRRMLTHLGSGDLVVDLETFPLHRAIDAWRLQQGAPHRKLILDTGSAR